MHESALGQQDCGAEAWQRARKGVWGIEGMYEHVRGSEWQVLAPTHHYACLHPMSHLAPSAPCIATLQGGVSSATRGGRLPLVTFLTLHTFTLRPRAQCDSANETYHPYLVRDKCGPSDAAARKVQHCGDDRVAHLQASRRAASNINSWLWQLRALGLRIRAWTASCRLVHEHEHVVACC